MILPDTPPGLVYDAMMGEAEKVGFYLKKHVGVAKKVFYRNGPWQKFHLSNYVIPSSRNRYLVWSNAKWSKNSFVPDVQWSGALLYINGPKGLDYWIAREINDDGRPTNYLFHYTGHFLSRYRERSGIQMGKSTDEVIATFLLRNTGLIFTLDFEKLQLNSEKYKDGEAMQVLDGIVFCSINEMTSPNGHKFVYCKMKTFLTLSNLKESQSENVKTYSEMRNYIYNEEMQKRWENHVESLKLHLKSEEKKDEDIS